MDVSAIAQYKELGIALIAVCGSGFLIKYIIDKNKEVFDVLIEQLKQNRTDYSDFVESNNHGNSERIEKSTQAMVEVAKAIEQHTRTSEQHTRILEKLLDKIEK